MMQLMSNKNHCRLASSGGVFQKKMPPLNGEIWILSPEVCRIISEKAAEFQNFHIYALVSRLDCCRKLFLF